MSRYFDSDIQTRFNIADWNMGTEGHKKNNQVKSREGELSIFSSDVHGVGSKKLWILPIEQMNKIHRYI